MKNVPRPHSLADAWSAYSWAWRAIHTHRIFFREENPRALALCAHRRAQDAGIPRGRNARPPHAAAILAAFTGSGNGDCVPFGHIGPKQEKAATAVPQSGGDPVIDFECAMVYRV